MMWKSGGQVLLQVSYMQQLQIVKAPELKKR